MIIVEPYDLGYGAGAFKCVVTTGGSTPENLVSNDPREVWSGGASGAYNTILIDFGADTQWDVIVLVNSNATSGATMRVTDGTQAQGTATANTVIAAGAVARAVSETGLFVDVSGPIVAIAPSRRTSRYVAIDVLQPAGKPVLTIGRLIIGPSWNPVLPRELGAGRPILDSGSRERLADGGLATVSGTLVSGFQWVFGDLESGELDWLFGIVRRRRTTEPIVLIEDPGAVRAEAVHYGTFVSLEKYERFITSKSRWVLTVEDW